MSAASWVSLIALVGWLVLMLGAFRAHRLGSKRTLAIALTWAAIFLLVTAIIAVLGGTARAPT